MIIHCSVLYVFSFPAVLGRCGNAFVEHLRKYALDMTISDTAFAHTCQTFCFFTLPHKKAIADHYSQKYSEPLAE